MNLTPLIAIPAIYFAVAIIKPTVQKKIPLNLCAICFAVSLTWLGLFIAFLFGARVSETTIGILIGMSVTGVMYKLEPVFKKNRIKNFWFARLAVIVGGFYLADYLIKRHWSGFILALIITLLAIVIAAFLFQGVSHKEAVREAVKGGKKESVLKKLDNCC